MNQETETRILDMLSEISSRLTILEETNQAAYNNTINNELDNLMEEDNSVMRKPSRKGSSTLHIAENYNPVNNYSSTPNIPAFASESLQMGFVRSMVASILMILIRLRSAGKS